jgi:hypothetical protein
LLQGGGKKPQEEKEVAPAEFYCSLEVGVPERVAPAVPQISAEKGISRRANCLVFAPAVLVFEISRTPQ